ncbi:unnamed protein product [Sphenostylis stenocarpa]|uniref:Uncharacterized protein n=1 Tax=Sphenostylis stenocarpa TaxID=92480 RepID=A0AA86RWV4_9FABA|nr:unnamed protein product [Sphenostylis stenocarpa]
MVLVSVGVVISSYGEIQFNVLGTVYQVTGIIAEALRLGNPRLRYSCQFSLTLTLTHEGMGLWLVLMKPSNIKVRDVGTSQHQNIQDESAKELLTQKNADDDIDNREETLCYDSVSDTHLD